VTGVTWRWFRGDTEITGADAQDNTYTLLQADAGEDITATVYYVVTGNTSQDTAEKTTDYPVLEARVGANQLEFDPAAVSRTISEGDEGRNVGAPVTATGNHGTIRYTLTGTDADQFEIDEKTGQIKTSEDLNYESDATDTTNQCDTPNRCEVTVTARDSTSDASDPVATVAIRITDVDEKPTFPAAALAMLESPENREALFDTNGPVTTVNGVTYAATDPEGQNITYHLIGPDASKFQFSAARVLSFKEDQEPDYEMPGDVGRDNVYEVTVRANDGTMTADKMVRVTVTDVNEGPVVSGRDEISYAENGEGAVGAFTARDPEGGTSITWSLATDATIDGVEAADIADGTDHFTIDEDGVLKFSSPPDFENPSGEGATSNTYKVVVLAADAATGGQTGYHKVTVKVTNLNESGTITLATSTDNGTPQYLIGATLTAIAEDGDITNAIQTFTVDRPGEVAGVTWEWYSGGTRISAATTNSYQLQQSDVGKNIRVLVRYQVDGKPSRESAQKSTETGVTWRWFRGDTEITGADAQDNTYTLLQADAGEDITATVYYVVTGNTSQDTAEKTTDYPVLEARVGANQLEFDPAAVSRTISEGDEGRNVGAPVTATGNHIPCWRPGLGQASSSSIRPRSPGPSARGRKGQERRRAGDGHGQPRHHQIHPDWHGRGSIRD
jgi:hypothetical protein